MGDKFQHLVQLVAALAGIQNGWITFKGPQESGTGDSKTNSEGKAVHTALYTTTLTVYGHMKDRGKTGHIYQELRVETVREILSGDPYNPPPTLDDCVDALLLVAEEKTAELHKELQTHLGLLEAAGVGVVPTSAEVLHSLIYLRTYGDKVRKAAAKAAVDKTNIAFQYPGGPNCFADDAVSGESAFRSLDAWLEERRGPLR
jgi:hypothetical protein